MTTQMTHSVEGLRRGEGRAMTLYDDLKAANVPLDHYESDLYVKATPESTRIIQASGHTYSGFVSQIDDELWYDVPFAYAPWWEQRLAREEPR